MVKKKQLLIVDDHPLFREGIKAIIGSSPEFEVVGEAGDARTGLQLASECRPDIILVDISLPDQSGIDLTKTLKSVLPETHILVVSMHSKMGYIIEAFQAGALGYLVKESAGDGLLKALGSIAKGEFFLDNSVSSAVVSKILKTADKEVHVADTQYRSLTSREQEILRLLAEGFSVKDIGSRLYISPKTVENHRTNIMHKLEVKRPLDLVRYAARIGLIDVETWKEEDPSKP
jgi:DNA-binding NarL/FixJ family response regulator